MSSLGAMYSNGKGVAQNDQLAFDWFQKGASAGHAHAMYCLSWAYENGRGVAKNSAQARNWLEKAAANGSQEASRKLGIHLVTGQWNIAGGDWINIYPNGAFRVHAGIFNFSLEQWYDGTVSCLDNQKRLFAFKHKGVIEEMTLSSDGNTLSGPQRRFTRDIANTEQMRKLGQI